MRKNGQLKTNFYGMLIDIIPLEHTGLPLLKLVIFKCDWFDNTPNIEKRVDNEYEIVKVRFMEI